MELLLTIKSCIILSIIIVNLPSAFLMDPVLVDMRHLQNQITHKISLAFETVNKNVMFTLRFLKI
jgi:hypothetical protein